MLSFESVVGEVANEIHTIFLRDLDLIGHNLESFDQGLEQIFEHFQNREWIQVSRESTGMEAVYRIRITNCRLTNPTVHNDITAMDEDIAPKDCIEREMTYGGKLRGTVQVFVEGNLQTRLREALPPTEVDFMTVPIPVGSRFCNTIRAGGQGSLHPDVFSLRGCFIIRGQKKNIICFEMPASNIPVFLHSNDEGYYSEIRSHSSPVKHFEVTAMVYSNVVKMKKGVLLFQSRTFKTCNSAKAITLVNVLSNLGLHTFEAIRAALLGSDPSPELEEAMAMTLANPDDFPLPPTPEQIRSSFGAAPLSLGSHLGRKSSQTHVLSTFRTERHSDWAKSIIEREILPHCGNDDNAKVIVLCEMARRVALGTFHSHRSVRVVLDNRDDLSNKQIKGYADLMKELIITGMKEIRDEINKTVRRTEKAQRPPSSLTRQTFPSISSLPWCHPDAMKTIANGQISSRPRGKGVVKSPVRKGLTQNYGGLNIMYDIACLRNFKNPINKQSKCESIRQIQASSFGYYCPTETREGQDVGLDHAMALQATTTLNGSVEPIVTVIEQFGHAVPITHVRFDDTTTYVVYMNGMPLYFLPMQHGEAFARHIRTARRKALIHPHVSITMGGPFEMDEHKLQIHIRFNPGRLTAVYMIVDGEGDPAMYQRIGTAMVLKERMNRMCAEEVLAIEKLLTFSFQDLFKPLTITFQRQVYEFEAAVEWIDVFERKNTRVSEFVKDIEPGSTHVMVHPSLMLGSSAAEVPFPDHNQSPRNAYQCGMGKQSIAGRPLTSIIDTHIPPYLLYPQKPLLQTAYTRMLLEKHPCPTGFNGIVAIMARGRNQEDAIIVNRDSIQRGMGATLHEQVYRDCARNTGLDYESGLSQADKFAYPDPDKVCNGFATKRRYDHIDENGFAIVGSVVTDGDPLICKLRKFQARHECITTMMHGHACKCEYANSPTCYKGNDTAVVDRVQVTTNAQGDKMVNIVVRYIRSPACGDKLASRHGQKGTIGAIVNREDLPFMVRDGTSPDIIINPHAIPSRMTIAHLIETLAGCLTCVTGKDIDATCFGEDSQSNWTAPKLAAALKAHGYSSYAEEAMICGMTGQMITSTVFTGPIFYQRMKQMPIDKAHARATGQVMTSTRQPREGRSKKGGFRCGEMERDCLTSHGASAVVQERFMCSSDPYKIYVCDVCCRPCVGNADERKRIFKCTTCGNLDPEKMSIVEMPYAGKLLNQEIMGLRVAVDIVTENSVAYKQTM